MTDIYAYFGIVTHALRALRRRPRSLFHRSGRKSDRRLGARDVPGERVAGGAPDYPVMYLAGLRCTGWPTADRAEIEALRGEFTER